MKNLKMFLLAAALLLGVQYASAAWTDPSAIAPANNTDAPINVGDGIQQKLGAIAVNTDTSNPYATGLTVFGTSDLYGSLNVAQDSELKTLTVSGKEGVFGGLDVTGPVNINGTIQITDGTQAPNRVLVSDGSGKAHWADISTLTGGSGNIVTSFQNAPGQGSVAGRNYGSNAYWCPGGSYVDGMFWYAVNGYIIPTGLQCEHPQSR